MADNQIQTLKMLAKEFADFLQMPESSTTEVCRWLAWAVTKESSYPYDKYDENKGIRCLPTQSKGWELYQLWTDGGIIGYDSTYISKSFKLLPYIEDDPSLVENYHPPLSFYPEKTWGMNCDVINHFLTIQNNGGLPVYMTLKLGIVVDGGYEHSGFTLSSYRKFEPSSSTTVSKEMRFILHDNYKITGTYQFEITPLGYVDCDKVNTACHLYNEYTMDGEYVYLSTSSSGVVENPTFKGYAHLATRINDVSDIFKYRMIHLDFNEAEGGEEAITFTMDCSSVNMNFNDSKIYSNILSSALGNVSEGNVYLYTNYTTSNSPYILKNLSKSGNVLTVRDSALTGYTSGFIVFPLDITFSGFTYSRNVIAQATISNTTKKITLGTAYLCLNVWVDKATTFYSHPATNTLTSTAYSTLSWSNSSSAKLTDSLNIGGDAYTSTSIRIKCGEYTILDETISFGGGYAYVNLAKDAESIKWLLYNGMIQIYFNS